MLYLLCLYERGSSYHGLSSRRGIVVSVNGHSI